MLKVGIIGAGGYAGEEIINILLKHSRIKINYLADKIEEPVAIGKLLPMLSGRLDLNCVNFNLQEAIKSSELFFLALPHTASMRIAPLLLNAGKKAIDLSADYRIQDYRLYESWYKAEHNDKNNIRKAIYGLPEIYGNEIRKAGLIANPGCYPTAAILALAPLLKSRACKINSIIIDAKSGYSGAGRKKADDPFWTELKDNFKAYKVDNHQHSIEINQEAGHLAGKNLKVAFVPHLLPIERGILETIYIKFSGTLAFTVSGLNNLYKKFYKNKPFVRIRKEGEFPQIQDVRRTNFCDIGLKVSQDKKLIIIISAIDNLVKGASGQAVQNMNLMYGFKETEGLL